MRRAFGAFAPLGRFLSGENPAFFGSPSNSVELDLHPGLQRFGQMKSSAQWSPGPDVRVVGVEHLDEHWLISATSTGSGTCPRCSVRSSARHGHYVRQLQDLAAQGLVVMLSVRMERWRCRNPRCKQQAFAHQLPRVAAAHARRTNRVAELVRLLDPHPQHAGDIASRVTSR